MFKANLYTDLILYIKKRSKYPNVELLETGKLSPNWVVIPEWAYRVLMPPSYEPHWPVGVKDHATPVAAARLCVEGYSVQGRAMKGSDMSVMCRHGSSILQVHDDLLQAAFSL